MALAPLNLASHPFRNERLPATLFGLFAALVVALTAWQALELRRLLPADGNTVSAEVRDLDAELAALHREAETLGEVSPTPDQLDEWRQVRDLVDRRSFAWTALLGRLEELLPPGVRLVSITPAFEDGVARLDLRAVARTREDGFSLWRALQQSAEFQEVLPGSLDDGPDGVTFTYSMLYRPGSAAPPVGETPAPASGRAG